MRKALFLFLAASLACAQQTLPPSNTPYTNFTQGFKLNGSFGTPTSCPLSTGTGTVWGSCGIGIPGLTTDSNNGINVQGQGLFLNGILTKFKPRFDLDAYGAAGNAVKITGCGITSGTKILTCGSGSFPTSAVAGQAIFVVGAGPNNGLNGSALVSVIGSWQSTTQVTLNDNAGQTANGQVAYYGSDDQSFAAQCLSDATFSGGECHFNDAKMYMLSDTATTLHVTGAAKGSGMASDSHGTLVFAPYGTLTPGSNDRLFSVSSSITLNTGSSGGIVQGASSFQSVSQPTLTAGQDVLIAEVSFPGGFGYFDWMKVASTVANDTVVSGTYTSGISATGSAGQSCTLTTFNGGVSGTTATIYLTGTNAVAASTPFYINTGGTGAANTPPTSAVASNGSGGNAATCSGTVVVSTTLGMTINTTKPFRMNIPDTAPVWTGSLTLTQVARVGALVTYTYSAVSGQRPWPGSMITITGFTNGANNGTLKVLTVSGGSSGTFTTTSQLQVNETHAGTGASVGAGNQGMIYYSVTGTPVENFYLKNFKVIAPVLGVGEPLIFNYQAIVNGTIENTTLDTPSAQALEWFMDREGQIIKNKWNTYGEVPSSVDVNIAQNIFDAQPNALTSYLSSCPGHPTTTSLDLDLGLGFSSFIDNKILNWCNIGVTMYQGVHDLNSRGNIFTYSKTSAVNAIGMVMIGGYHNQLYSNTLEGTSDGTGTTAIVTEDSLLYGINSDQNLVRNNIIAATGWNNRINCSGTLGTDAVFDIDASGAEQQLCGGGGQPGTVTIGPASGAPPLNGLNYRGNTTSGEQFVFGSNLAGASFTSTIGTQFSSGAVFLAHNAMQTTTGTDQWTQPLASSRSTFVSVDALNGFRYCLNNSGQANAAFSTFFPSCPITFTPNGHTYLESQSTGAVNLNVRSGAGTGGVIGGNGSGSSTWSVSGAGAATFIQMTSTGPVSGTTGTFSSTLQGADLIDTALGASTQPPCPNGTSNKFTLSGCTFPMNVEMNAVTQISPTAAATYYVGIGGAAINGNAAQQVPFWVPRAGTVGFVHLGCQVAGTLDTGNNLVTATITDANGTNFSDTQVTFNLEARLGDGTATGSDAVAAGHKLLLKLVMPASWTTQPTLVSCSANFQYN